MKKLLAIIVLGLLLGGNAIAIDFPIKERKLQCLFNEFDLSTAKKESYLYIDISENDNTAQFIQLPDRQLFLSNNKFNVTLSLYWITFKRDNDESLWEINRKSGELKQYIKTKEIAYGKCEPIPSGFYPKKYLEDLAKKRLKKEYDKLKY